MKTNILYLAGLAMLCGSALAQETQTPPQQKATVPSATTNTPPKSSAEELETRFKATMTKATMSGRWCLIEDGTLGPEKEDKYTILSVSKLGGDAWIVNARIEYNQKSMVVPVPVAVKWAGDTPVLIVDKIPMPSGGVFSARVLIYDNTYAGTWSGGDHAGLLKGVIKNEANDNPPPSQK
jgi:hypothetical protein